MNEKTKNSKPMNALFYSKTVETVVAWRYIFRFVIQ